MHCSAHPRAVMRKGKAGNGRDFECCVYFGSRALAHAALATGVRCALRPERCPVSGRVLIFIA